MFLGEVEERKVNFFKISERLKSKDNFVYQNNHDQGGSKREILTQVPSMHASKVGIWQTRYWY
jgi:hypothetical protein